MHEDKLKGVQWSISLLPASIADRYMIIAVILYDNKFGGKLNWALFLAKLKFVKC